MKENLILDNINLIYYVLKQLNLYEKRDDYFDVGMIGLCKAADTYNTDKKAAFSTYAYSVIMNSVLHEIRRENSNKQKINNDTISLSKPVSIDGDREILLEDVLSNDINIEEEICYKETLEELDKCIDELPPREKVILIYYYGLYGTRRCNQQEISKELCVSQCLVSRHIRKAEKRLRGMMCKYL